MDNRGDGVSTQTSRSDDGTGLTETESNVEESPKQTKKNRRKGRHHPECMHLCESSGESPRNRQSSSGVKMPIRQDQLDKYEQKIPTL